MAENANVNLYFTVPASSGVHPVGEGGQEPGYIMALDGEWEFEMENKDKMGLHTSGGGAGYAEFKEFTFKKLSDSATTDLYAGLASGGHFDQVELIAYKSSGNAKLPSNDAMKFLHLKFDTVVISKMTWSCSEKGPSELLTLKFSGMHIEYWKQNTKTGLLTSAGEYYWNAVNNSNSPIAV